MMLGEDGVRVGTDLLAALIVVAFKRMPRWRRVIGTVLMAAPHLVLATLAVSFVLLKMLLGAEFHWRGGTAQICINILCVVLILCGSVLVGLRLRRERRRNAI
jgi:ABC-type uncharacterized transport system YnjBCD permease subunit